MARERSAVASELCVPGFRRVCLSRAPLEGVRILPNTTENEKGRQGTRVHLESLAAGPTWRSDRSPKSPSSASPSFGGFALSSVWNYRCGLATVVPDACDSGLQDVEKDRLNDLRNCWICRYPLSRSELPYQNLQRKLQYAL